MTSSLRATALTIIICLLMAIYALSVVIMVKDEDIAEAAATSEREALTVASQRLVAGKIVDKHLADYKTLKTAYEADIAARDAQIAELSAEVDRLKR